MFCPVCGKQIKDEDNFCRYCGADLRNQEAAVENYEIPEEEYVLYDVKKHYRTLLLPIFLTPLFLFYFWNIFLNTHSFFSWLVVFAILGFIIYPIARYKSDKIIVTTKFAHVKVGVLNPEEIDIPLDKLDMLEISQTSMGRLFDYGMVTLESNSDRIEYGFIKSPEELQYIIENPKKFIAEEMELV